MIHLFFNTKVGEVKGLLPDELRQMRRNAADGVLEHTRNHLLALPGKSFYRDAAQSLERVSTAQDDEVRITQRGVALQHYGGTVEPGKGLSSKTGKPTKFLAIPSALAKGKSPRLFQDLSYVPVKNGGKVAALLMRVPEAARTTADKAHKQKLKEHARKVKKAAKGGQSAPPRPVREKPKPQLYFTLVSSATIKPHPNVLPKQVKLHHAAREGALDYLETLSFYQ